jgi:hypothetical protein
MLHMTRGSEATPAVGWGPDGFAGGAGRARALPGEKPFDPKKAK